MVIVSKRILATRIVFRKVGTLGVVLVILIMGVVISNCNPTP